MQLQRMWSSHFICFSLLLFNIAAVESRARHMQIITEKLPNATYVENALPLHRMLEDVRTLYIFIEPASELSNDVIVKLQHQSLCTIHLMVAQRGHMDHIFNSGQRNRAVTVRNAVSLVSRVFSYAHVAGKLFCIIAYDVSVSGLLYIARREWLLFSIYKIYYIMPERTLIYNPFAWNSNDNAYGNLIDVNIMTLEDLFRNLHGYPVRTYIFDSAYSGVQLDAKTNEVVGATGVDAKVARLLSRIMNFTLDLQKSDGEYFGFRMDNGLYNGAIGRMMRYETDITLTGFFIKDYRTRRVEFTMPVYEDKLCCYVMKSKRIPQTLAPLFAVKGDMWMGFLLAGLFSGLFWLCIRYFNTTFRFCTTQPSRYQIFLKYLNLLSDTCVVWCRANLTKFPPFASERIFVLSLCLVSVIFGALFESSLATVYIEPMYYKDINTLEELNDAGYDIRIKHAAMMDDLFFGHNSCIYKDLDMKTHLVPETGGRLIDEIAKNGGFAAVSRASAFMLGDIIYTATKKIHMIPDCPKIYNIAYAWPAKSPYERRVNVLLLQFVQAGLINHWVSLMKHHSSLSLYNLSGFLQHESTEWKTLKLEDVQLAFIVLMLGGTLAAIVCLLEYAVKYRRKFRFSILKWKQLKIKNREFQN